MYLALLCYEDIDLPNGWDPYYIYLIMVDEVEIGRITLRTNYSDLTYYTGHIGYEIYEPFRRNGYGFKALKMIQSKIEEIGYDFVWLSCNPNNIASKKIIQQVAQFIEEVVVPEEFMIYLNEDEKRKEVYKWTLR